MSQLDQAMVRSQYNRIAPIFSIGSKLTFPHRDHINRKLIQPRLGLREGQTVLDLCCGAGLNFPYIEDCIGPTGRLLGLDFSDRLVERAQALTRASGWSNVTVYEGDALKLGDVIDEPVDAVLCSLAACLIPNKKAFFEAIKSLLRPNGRLAVLEFMPFKGWLGAFNPLLKIALCPIPVNIKAVFDEAPQVKQSMNAAFANCVHAEFYSGSVYVGVAQKEDDAPSPAAESGA
jgi:ubiquinone/menaquinone biosynthesis C-methylase UbiE